MPLTHNYITDASTSSGQTTTLKTYLEIKPLSPLANEKQKLLKRSGVVKLEQDNTLTYGGHCSSEKDGLKKCIQHIYLHSTDHFSFEYIHGIKTLHFERILPFLDHSKLTKTIQLTCELRLR